MPAFHPHATVACIAERHGRFLMVREPVRGNMVLNQPSGHLEDGESLMEAVIRETREETRWGFMPQGLVGVYRWRIQDGSMTFLRVCFHGQVTEHDENLSLDPAIDSVHWLTADQLRARSAQCRSPMVLTCLEDYLAGKRYPLELLVDLP